MHAVAFAELSSYKINLIRRLLVKPFFLLKYAILRDLILASATEKLTSSYIFY